MTTLVLPNNIIGREERTVKKRRIQSQLLMLLHAIECSDSSCSRPNCDQFKSLADHLRACGDGVGCQHPYCNSSRIILKHWEKCESRTCPVCYPIEIVGGVDRGRWRTMLFSQQHQVSDAFADALFPPPPPPSLPPSLPNQHQSQNLDEIQNQDEFQDESQLQLQNHPQHELHELPQDLFHGQQRHHHQQHQHRQQRPLPTAPTNESSTNQNQASSRLGPIRNRRRFLLPPSRPDAAGLIRRVAKLRGAILSETKTGDADIKLDDWARSGVAKGGAVDVNTAVTGSPLLGAGKRLDEELEFHRRRAECPVCWEHLKSVALQCGHQCCHRCAANLQKCHSCRSEILIKIKLF